MEGGSLSLIIVAVCIVMSAYFSATETAFSALNRIRIKNMADKGNRKAQLVVRLSEDYDSLLSTILIGNNIVNIACASVAAVLFVDLLGQERGTGVSTLVTTVVVLIFGEVSPKSIAKESPERFAMFAAPFLHVLVKILTPFNFLFGQWKKLLSRIFKSSDEEAITEEELLSIIEEAKEGGGIDEQEQMLMQSAIEFTERKAMDILTPRVDITAVSVDASAEEIQQIFSETGFSRLPVYDGNLDHIVGIIYQKDFYRFVFSREKKTVEIIRPALFVLKSKKIGVLLKELQQKKMHIAVVLDEFGGTVGIITLEDILEELVGEIWDEYDEVCPEIEKRSDEEYYVLGSANAEKIFELLKISADGEEEQAVTVSGWVMEMLGRLAEEKDSFTYQGWNVDVLEIAGKRVKKVRFARIEEEEHRNKMD